MIYIESGSTDPCFNLALEQYAFERLPQNNDYFMLWQNENAIIVGKYQNTAAEINAEYVNSHGIRVVRRLSGGGAVYHDLGNINFTFIVNEKNIEKLDLQAFCAPLVRTLGTIGIEAEVNGRNDITIDGRKFSGNAQYMKNGRVLHHGTIMFDSDIQTLTEALNVPEDKIESKGVKSVKSRVTCVKEHLTSNCTVGEFWEILKKNMMGETMAEPYALTDADIAAINEIKTARYDTWEWNYGMSPAYSIVKKRRVEGCGCITVSMNVENGAMMDYATSGDYFASDDYYDVKDALLGCRLEAEALKAALRGLEIERYYHNLTSEQLIEIILQ